MMKITKVVTSPVSTNTYILTFFGGDAIVIDPGGEKEKIEEILRKENSICRAILLTHAHFDHTGAVAALAEGGAKIYLHADDVKLIREGNMAEMCGMTLTPFVPDVVLHGGEELDVAGQRVMVLHTPGHTAGSVCYIIGGALFSGDTLFYLSVGRTDFPSGDAKALAESLRKLFSLRCDYPVYPGHDRMTNLFFEKENNPYV